ncbi:MAG: hypothetical protein J6575_04890 [Bifidobacterium sp.]|nr:hypothetical protein [Bifidobacterium sp.]
MGGNDIVTVSRNAVGWLIEAMYWRRSSSKGARSHALAQYITTVAL